MYFPSVYIHFVLPSSFRATSDYVYLVDCDHMPSVSLSLLSLAPSTSPVPALLASGGVALVVASFEVVAGFTNYTMQDLLGDNGDYIRKLYEQKMVQGFKVDRWVEAYDCSKGRAHRRACPSIMKRHFWRKPCCITTWHMHLHLNLVLSGSTYTWTLFCQDI